MAYITAEFAEDLLPADSLFVVGGDAQPNDRADIYSNGPLQFTMVLLMHSSSEHTL